MNVQLREKQSFLNSRIVESDFKHGSNDFKDQIESGKYESVKNLLTITETSFSKFIFRLDTPGHKIFWSVLLVVIISVSALLYFY